jgi:hypothetical protein
VLLLLPQVRQGRCQSRALDCQASPQYVAFGTYVSWSHLGPALLNNTPCLPTHPTELHCSLICLLGTNSFALRTRPSVVAHTHLAGCRPTCWATSTLASALTARRRSSRRCCWPWSGWRHGMRVVHPTSLQWIGWPCMRWALMANMKLLGHTQHCQRQGGPPHMWWPPAPCWWGIRPREAPPVL